MPPDAIEKGETIEEIKEKLRRESADSYWYMTRMLELLGCMETISNDTNSNAEGLKLMASLFLSKHEVAKLKRELENERSKNR